MSAPHHSRCRGGLHCFSPVTSSWPLARCHNPNCAPRHLLTHARPAHGSGGFCVPQALSLCQAGYGCLLSNSGQGWQLKPVGTLSAFPLQHPHRARLSCTRPSPAAPGPHRSPGARRHPAPYTMPGDTVGRGFASRGDRQNAGTQHSGCGRQGGEAVGITVEGGRGPGVSALTQCWSGCGAGTAASPDSWQSPRGAGMCLQTPGAGRHLTCLFCPTGWSQGGKRLKLLPEAHPSPCHPLISWTSLWDEHQGMMPGFDPTSKVREGHEASRPGSNPCLRLPKTREWAGMEAEA